MLPSGKPPGKDENSQFINHEMQDALSGLNEANYWWFYMSTQDLVDDEDIPKIKKSAVLITRNVLVSFGLGIALNVQIKRVPKINFLTWNRYLRWFCRVPILAAPFLIFHRSFGEEYMNFLGFHAKYYKRIRAFQRTGDMRYLDPHGKMIQKLMG